MNNKPSRMEQLLESIAKTAEVGDWNIVSKLYSNEAKKIVKQWGVEVTPLREFRNSEVFCIISWANAFPDGLNPEQDAYIAYETDERPEVENYAQSLFLTAARIAFV